MNKLRNSLPFAYVTSYTYSPLIGITSETDPHGKVVYFQYDTHGRLVNVRDDDFNVIETYSYRNVGEQQYSNVYYNIEQTDSFSRLGCTVPYPIPYKVKAGQYISYISQYDADQKAANDIMLNGQKYAEIKGGCLTYYNDSTSQTFNRNNCSGGVLGSEVVYFVPANKYNSVISKADANSKALADIVTNGQNYANSVGSCAVYSNELQSQQFFRNNCTGMIGTSVTYSVPANTYTSTISLSDANQKAFDDIALNGQNHANTNGECFNPYMSIDVLYSYDDWLTGTMYFDIVVSFSRNQGGTLTPLTTLPSGIPINWELEVGYGDPYYGYIVTPYTNYTIGTGSQVLMSGVPGWGPDPASGWDVRILTPFYEQYLFSTSY